MWDFDAEVDTLDEVPEEFKGLYTEADGKFTLNAKLVVKIGQGTGAKIGLDRERLTVASLKEKLRAFKAIGETPEALQQRITELEEAATASPDKQAIEATIARRYEAKITTLTNENTELRTQVTTVRGESDADFLNNEIASAIAASDALPNALRPILRERARVERDDQGVRRLVVRDDKGEEVLTPRGEPVTSLVTYASLLKTNDEYGFAFKAVGTSGGGSNPNHQRQGGGGAKNPFDPKTLNLTEAQALITSNPGRAKQLAEAVGHAVTW
jgi:hypothetical protein